MQNVILIGFMGSGKSTIGKRLSYKMRITMIDTDSWIEKKEGKTITDIFKDQGESYFRECETHCLEKLIEDKERHVISVGGGLPMNPENWNLLHELGHIVYLQITPENVWERLKNDMKRPLLQGDNPKEKIVTLMNERKETYEQLADTIIDVNGKNFDIILKEIQDKL